MTFAACFLSVQLSWLALGIVLAWPWYICAAPSILLIIGAVAFGAFWGWMLKAGKMKQYDVILADPPWTFSVWNAEKSDRHASHKYDLMDIKDICALPISNLTADNCVLFLWATWPNIQDAFKVIEAWGFTYRTLGWEWVKAKESGFGFHFGMGYYTRSNPEPCLLAVKGTMAVAVHDISALIYSPIQEHSRKPDDQYRKIEALYPGRTYLELFARRHRPGWDVFGNEVEGSIGLTPGD